MVLEEGVQVLVRVVDEQLVREDVQLHSDAPRWLLTVLLQHAEAVCVQNTQAVLQVGEPRFGDGRECQPVVLQ